MLSHPATHKHTEEGENLRLMYGLTDMQGWRVAMEDAHAAILDLDEEGGDTNAFFAVYDGHGGSYVAKFAGENLHKRLVLEKSYTEKNYEIAFKEAFLGVDQELRVDPLRPKKPSGCTAVAALVTEYKIYVANAGDSRSVISVKGEAKPLSFDHKPTNHLEQARILKGGGYVDFGRVNGDLALSRALGDFEFKENWTVGPEEQIVTAYPDVTCHERTEEDEFLVLACDGIWDCLSSQQVIDFVRHHVATGTDLTEIGKKICDYCLAPDTQSEVYGCDNMTVLIVALLQGRTKEEWYLWIKDRLVKRYGYPTPSFFRSLYSQSRVLFNAQTATSYNSSRPFEDNRPISLLSGPGLNSFTRVFNDTGRFTSPSVQGIMSGHRNLMFGSDDSEDGDEETLINDPFFTQTFSLGNHENQDNPQLSDSTQRLKARLDEFERSVDEEDGSTMSRDGKDFQEETPQPLKYLPNGDAQVLVPPVQQFSLQPSGDAALSVTKVEGFPDASEDPLKSHVPNS